MWLLKKLFSVVKYADEAMRTWPSLIQIWLVEFFIVVPLAFFIGKQIDTRGAWGIPGTSEPFDFGFLVFLGLALAGLFFFFKNLFFPRFRNDTYTPMSQSGEVVAGLSLVAWNRAARVTYPFLTSHPAYSLLLLTTVWIPIIMIWMCVNRGGNNLYYVASGIAGCWIVGALIALRFIVYYGLRRGPGVVRAFAIDQGVPPLFAGWGMAWRPTLLLVGLMYAIVAIPVTVMWTNELRAIARLPVVTAAMAETAPDPHVFGSDKPRTWVRVEGKVIDKPKLWPAGLNRGGDNYRGVGVRIALDSGGEALVFAESMSVPDLLTDLQRAEKTGRFKCSGYVVNAISADQTKYYGIDESYFPDAEQGRVLVIHGYP